MRLSRVIPVLLLQQKQLVKTTKFRVSDYLGDPMNAVKIFNDKWADELFIIDIDAGRNGKRIDFEFLSQLSKEAFIPLCYGGGINTVEDAEKILKAGFEKISVNRLCHYNPEIVTNIAKRFGSQSIVGSVDFKKRPLRAPSVFVRDDKDKFIDASVVEWCLHLQDMGVGEILLNCADRDGTGGGFDLKIIEAVAERLNVPLTVCGSAGSLEDIQLAVDAGASAVAASQLFMYVGKLKAVLPNYPDTEELEKLFSNEKK